VIRDLLHEQYETADGRPVLFRCTECGYRSQSLGSLHGHAEKHRGWFGFQLPWRYGDFEALMELTEVVAIEASEAVSLKEVEGL
jgi:hypothetical protein